MKLKFILRLFIFLIIALYFSSCSLIMYEVYGLKIPKFLEKDDIVRYAIKYNIPENKVFVLDTSYLKFLNTIPVVDTIIINDSIPNYKNSPRKNHAQPMQILYFDKNNKLISFHINCYVKGFPNQNWNFSGNFDTFIPKTLTPVDNFVSFDKLINYIKTLDGYSLNINDFENADYNIVVFWSRITGRQTKRMIATFNRNLKLNNKFKVNVLFVNDDNFQYKSF